MGLCIMHYACMKGQSRVRYLRYLTAVFGMASLLHVIRTWYVRRTYTEYLKKNWDASPKHPYPQQEASAEGYVIMSAEQ